MANSNTEGTSAAMMNDEQSNLKLPAPPTFLSKDEERDYLKFRLAQAFRIFGETWSANPIHWVLNPSKAITDLTKALLVISLCGWVLHDILTSKWIKIIMTVLGPNQTRLLLG